MSEENILIVGAGPTGLTLALLLKKEGIPFHIIDKKEGPHKESRALGVHAKTLEIWDDLGILDTALEKGKKIQAINAYIGIKKILTIRFSPLSTLYPFSLILPQSETERILTQHLQQKGVDVRWGAKLIEISERKDHLSTHIQCDDGTLSAKTYKYVIACDGAHSFVRDHLGISFRGKADDDAFVLGDIDIEGPISSDEASIFYGKQGISIVFPIRKGLFRAIFNNISPGETPPTLEDLQKLADERIPFNVKFKDFKWASHFSPCYRMVETFRAGGVFFAGDAAHVHSPAGGQGMNTGIQDVYNLAWKLALEMRGKAKDALMESYSDERLSIARDTLLLTHQLTKIVNAKKGLLQFLRNGLMKNWNKFPWVKSKMLLRLSGLSIHYRKSPIVMEIPSKRFLHRFYFSYQLFKSGPKAGDRLLDAVVYFNEQPKRFFKILEGMKHHFIIFLGYRVLSVSEELEAKIDRLRQWLSIHVHDETSIFLVSREKKHAFFQTWQEGLLLDKDGNLHKKYHAYGPCIYVVRPDKYIGLRDFELALDPVKDYFEKILVVS